MDYGMDASCTGGWKTLDTENKIDCLCLKLQEVVVGGSNAFNTDTWYRSLIFLSFLGNTFVGYMIYANKDLQVHPMRLFMWISFADAFMFSNYTMEVFLCKGQNHPILQFTGLTMYP